jgi:hypothetical protein
MIINFGDLSIQEAQLLLTGLKKLPMETVEGLHNRLLAMANEQFIAQQPKPEEVVKEAVEEKQQDE